MKNNLLIREAAFEDLEAIISVHHQSWRETYQGLISKESLEIFSHEKLRTQWQSILTSKQAQVACFVAELSGEIIGFVDCGPRRKTEPTLQGEYYAIYVLARAQKLGVGRALFERATEFLQRHFTSQSLWVLRSNKTAISFYEKCKGVAVESSLFQLGEESVEKICYLWKNESLAT